MAELTLEELQRQIDEINEKLNKPAQLTYPLDSESQRIMEKFVDEFLPDKIYDILWKNVFHWSTLFESKTGYSEVFTGAGSVTLDGTDINIATGGSTNDSSDLRKEPTWQGVITFSQRSFMRAGFNISDVTSQEIYIKVGRSASQGYGFKITDGNLYGVTHNGSSESTVLLQALSAGQAYVVEARYLPGQRVVFFASTPTTILTEKGSLTTTLPSPANAVNTQLMCLRVKTTTTASRSMDVSHFEYFQTRNVLK